MPQITGHRPQITGHRSKMTGHRSQVTGHAPEITYHRSQVTGHRSPITGHAPEAVVCALEKPTGTEVDNLRKRRRGVTSSTHGTRVQTKERIIRFVIIWVLPKVFYDGVCHGPVTHMYTFFFSFMVAFRVLQQRSRGSLI
jgi:hypothetical protein